MRHSLSLLLALACLTQSTTLKSQYSGSFNNNQKEDYQNLASDFACPAFTGAPPNVAIVNSTCSSGCTSTGGSFTAPAGTPCPAGSTLQYQVNGGAWSSILPVYNQSGPAQTIKTRCSCDTDTSNVSETSVGVVTVPGTCTLPIVSITGNNNICAGSSVTFAASGGVIYLWSTGVISSSITVSIPGTYTVTVSDANGCTATGTRTLTVNPIPVAAISGNNMICPGANTTFTATGGVTYAWNTGATTSAIIISTAGNYTVTATNAVGCTATATRILTINPIPTPIITGGNICSFNATTLTAIGGTAYQWNTGATTAAISVSTPGTYTVTVTNASGCTATATRTVTSEMSPIISISGSNVICEGVSTTFIATGGGTYMWSNGATTAAITVSTPGTYTVTVTSVNGCTASAYRTLTQQPCTTISGALLWEHNDITGVKDASVVISGVVGATVTTNASGQYSVFLAANGNYTIKPTKTTKPLNGVTSADALRLLQHLNGALLTDPYKMVAADINKSNSITSEDPTLITQALLGNPAAVAKFNPSWIFVPTSHTMSMPPWGFPTAINLTGASGIQADKNFFGIKVGDVNGSANPALVGTAPLVWTTPDQSLETGSAISVPFTVKQFQQLGAYQFALHFDTTRLHYETLAVNPQQSAITIDNFGLFNLSEGDIRSVWSSVDATDLPDDMVIFTVNFTVLNGGVKLSDALMLDETTIEADAYLVNGSSVGLDVVFSQSSAVDPNIALPGVRLWQNRPNPTSSHTVIGFETPCSMPFTLNLYDMAGRLIEQRRGQSVAGYQEETFRINLPAGMAWYELLTPSGVLTRKMTITE